MPLATTDCKNYYSKYGGNQYKIIHWYQNVFRISILCLVDYSFEVKNSHNLPYIIFIQNQKVPISENKNYLQPKGSVCKFKISLLNKTIFCDRIFWFSAFDFLGRSLKSQVS